MSSPGSHEAVAALERLLEKQVISLEEGQAAARLIMGDPAFAFPPAPAAPQASPAPTGEAAGPQGGGSE
jgi:hypothetical protein